jgi:Protein of unknown function (DUF1579)
MLLKLTLSGLLLAGAYVAGTYAPFTGPQDEKDREKMMAAYEKAGQPGEQHKALASWAGKWSQSGECPMGKWTGNVEYKSILGGRFVVGEADAKMQMGDKAVDFQSFQINGYDNVLKQYQTVWLDSMGTGVYLLPGTADASGKKLTFEGPVKDVLTPNGRPFRVVVTIDGDDKHTTELWDSKKDGKTLEKEATITETRVK